MVRADPLEAEATADDDFDGNNLSEEEETQLLGGEGFSPEQLAAAEKRFEEQMVGVISPHELHRNHNIMMEEARDKSREGQVQHPGNRTFHCEYCISMSLQLPAPSLHGPCRGWTAAR